MMQNEPSTSRRTFLKTSTAAALGGALSGPLILGTKSSAASPGDTIKVGLIGCGGRGSGAAKQALNADKNVILTSMGDAFQDRLFPGASALPDDSVTALLVNRNALESFLVGLNHEMSRELLWRGFPLRYGTYFSQFWDATLDDIGAIEDWTATSLLGAHSPEGAPIDTLLLVVRAELVRRIPDVIVYAAPARVGDSGSGRTVDFAGRVDPLFTGRLDPDIRFFGFPLTAVEAHGTGASDGWYFIFQEHPTAPRFGLNESTDAFGTKPERWTDLDWSQMARRASDPIVYADTGRRATMRGVMLPDGGESTLSHRWAFSAAHMAHITLQRPVQVAIHGSDLLESPK